jgi:hypothetical protein
LGSPTIGRDDADGSAQANMAGDERRLDTSRFGLSTSNQPGLVLVLLGLM